MHSFSARTFTFSCSVSRNTSTATAGSVYSAPARRTIRSIVETSAVVSAAGMAGGYHGTESAVGAECGAEV
jgi:hypothetical protein